MGMSIYEYDPWRDRFENKGEPRSLWGVAQKTRPFVSHKKVVNDKGEIVVILEHRLGFVGKPMSPRKKLKAEYRRTSTMLSFKQWLRQVKHL